MENRVLQRISGISSEFLYPINNAVPDDELILRLVNRVKDCPFNGQCKACPMVDCKERGEM